MSNFIYGEVFWFCELVCCGGEGGFFEEETDFLGGGEEVVIADVGGLAGGEFG